MRSLLELGAQHGTDKVGHGYLEHYARYFGESRELPLTLLEIGVMGGASLRMWRDYFPRARIFGLDIDPKTQFEEDRIAVLCGVQHDPQVLDSVCQKAGHFEIIIDDGSHCGKDHVASFEHLWPHLLDGGWYAIEDCQSMFNLCWTQPGDPTMFDRLNPQLKEIILGLNSIREVHVIGNWIYSGLLILRKGAIRPAPTQ